MMKITGNLVDIIKREIYPAEVYLKDRIIERIITIDKIQASYIMPGFVDAHVHIESSMLTPGSFAAASVPHGTIGVVADPHEIANVIGSKGVIYMIEDGVKSPMKFYFGAPSCVPATDFETNGARIDVADVRELLEREDIKFLAEIMNFPGVINRDPEVIEKIKTARKKGKPIDGHAPGLSGDSLRKYIAEGISTDHECTSYEEAIEKISLGMKVIIREGSAGKNLGALKSLYHEFPEMIMLSSDDIHPEMLRERHLDKLVAGLIDEGYDVFNVIRSVTINPVSHYNLNIGLLQPGDPADFIIVDNLRKMNVLQTWIDGKRVFDKGSLSFTYRAGKPVNIFNCSEINPAQLAVRNTGKVIRVITAFDGDLFTKEIQYETEEEDWMQSNTVEDILKIVVKDRYKDAPPAIGFIRGFGLKKGAFASSVAHDSHNIISVGTNDDDIAGAVNQVIKMKGGLAVTCEGTTRSLQLNIAGIMSSRSCDEVAAEYEKLSHMVKEMGSVMSAPFMTLSFMALLVIPELKLGDRGLFDVTRFQHVPLFIR